MFKATSSILQRLVRVGTTARSTLGYQCYARYSTTEPTNKQWSNTVFEGLPSFVKIVEVGVRDGLQNEKQIVPAKDKITLINRLADAGLKCIEATSFVSPKWVPQMADAVEVIKGIDRKPGVTYPVLVPNMQGLQNAVNAGAKEVAVFAAASEAFSKKNINASIAESLARYKDVCAAALEGGVKIRGYVSCVLGCPYEGEVPISKVVEIAQKLSGMGCYEVSLGDTIGVGTPGSTLRLMRAMVQNMPKEQIAVHFHDTYGQALSNILTSLQLGIATLDSSVAGLGGCPYAAGATGNVATEDVIYMLKDLGVDCGVNMQAILNIGEWISASIGRAPASRVLSAHMKKKAAAAAEAAKREQEEAAKHEVPHTTISSTPSTESTTPQIKSTPTKDNTVGGRIYRPCEPSAPQVDHLAAATKKSWTVTAQ